MPSRAGRPARRRAPADADWAFHADDRAIFAALAGGRRTAALREYFGTPSHAELAALAAAVRESPQRARGPRVLILPGIMGSKLGARSGAVAGALWMDPASIAAGKLTQLSLPRGRRFGARGVMLTSYARLKLELEAAGCRADLHAYDWRRGIDELGRGLADRIMRMRAPVTVIAHSMGGLVARVAAGLLPGRWLPRLVLIGTPNQGSFAAVQALRGTYPSVRKIAMLDLKHSVQFLSEHVFNTFPGLYHLLPGAESTGIDLFDLRAWPSGRPRLRPALLAAARAARARLAPADERLFNIVGVNQDTVVGLRRVRSGFEYQVRPGGDGTVPVSLAALPGLDNYYVDDLHSNLANNRRVIAAVVELVGHGRTRKLPRRFEPKPGAGWFTDDAALKAERLGKIDWRALTPAEREAALAEFDSARLVCRIEP